jgi:hypothetical protein
VAIAVLVMFVAVVLALTVVSRQRGARVQSCCAPADPAADLRMRPAFDSDSSTDP